MGQKFNITESERNQIRGLYEQLEVSTQNKMIGSYGSQLTPANRGQLSQFDDGFEWKFSNNDAGNVMETVKFKGDINVINQLYDIFMNCLKNQSSQRINLGGVSVDIKGIKFGGMIKSIKISVSAGSTIMTEKHIEKLFGK
jgi:hypothetical protein